MLTISKPLTAAQIRTYHAEEFSNARENYYTHGERIHGEWHGRLADRWGLRGPVSEQHIERLADGRHPLTDEALVRHNAACTYTDGRGKTVKSMAHRAGWDATFSAPKSVSLTALVGRDEHVIAAHRASVRVALDELERYVQARIGNNWPAETTGQWVTATFLHDSSRPVAEYAAPQLHTHAVIFNVTQRDTGEHRALQPRELYKSQQFATAVYRSELASRLTALGYEIERGAHGQPEIAGYTFEYLEASSPRRGQIEARLADVGYTSAEAAHIAAHQTREAKSTLSHDEMQRRHDHLALTFGNQPARIVRAALERRLISDPQIPHLTAQDALTFARERNFEREAVVDDRVLLRDALSRSMGELPLRAVRSEFERHVQTGELLPKQQSAGRAGRVFTTPEMVALESDTVRFMQRGRNTQAPLVDDVVRLAIGAAHPDLNDDQRAAVQSILANRDRVVALEGVAGAGKTTALAAVRDGAERAGYAVLGLAPTSRAAQKLADSGIVSITLQAHLARRRDTGDGAPRLFVVDESSLASTRQINAFLHRLDSRDRVLFVGDVRQHQAVDAGTPYQQLQNAGMQVARLDQIVRQRDPALKAVVEHLSRGDVATALGQLERHGRIHQIPDRDARLTAIARAYVSGPHATLVVSPDNQSRMELNHLIHRQLQGVSTVERREHRVRVLVPRQEITGADRQWAHRYAVGDVVRYTTGSRTLWLRRGDYAQVLDINPRENSLTVIGQTGQRVTYDPRRLHGVTLYRETERAFARGDRVQFTAPDHLRRIANRELGTIEKIAASGDLTVRLDSGRRFTFNVADHPHLDYGYAVTSHSAQGQTADRVLIHVDTDQIGEALLNRRLAYVAISRGRYDAQIYTDDRSQLTRVLNRDVSHPSALDIAQQRPHSQAIHR